MDEREDTFIEEHFEDHLSDVPSDAEEEVNDHHEDHSDAEENEEDDEPILRTSTRPRVMRISSSEELQKTSLI